MEMDYAGLKAFDTPTRMDERTSLRVVDIVSELDYPEGHSMIASW